MTTTRLRWMMAACAILIATAVAGKAQSGTVNAAAPAAPAPIAKPGSPSDYFSDASFGPLAAKLLEQAKASKGGSTSALLATYDDHFMNLTARVKSGGGEVHKHYHDVFVAVDGEATIVTGGTIPDLKFDEKGEGKGEKVVGGTSQVLKKGDVLHITAGVPHQTLVAPGKTFTYFVVKVYQK